MLLLEECQSNEERDGEDGGSHRAGRAEGAHPGQVAFAAGNERRRGGDAEHGDGLAEFDRAGPRGQPGDLRNGDPEPPRTKAEDVAAGDEDTGALFDAQPRSLANAERQPEAEGGNDEREGCADPEDEGEGEDCRGGDRQHHEVAPDADPAGAEGSQDGKPDTRSREDYRPNGDDPGEIRRHWGPRRHYRSPGTTPQSFRVGPPRGDGGRGRRPEVCILPGEEYPVREYAREGWPGGREGDL